MQGSVVLGQVRLERRFVIIPALRRIVASCLVLIANSCWFAVIRIPWVMEKDDFVLTNQDLGGIGEARLCGGPVTIRVLGPLCDVCLAVSG